MATTTEKAVQRKLITTGQAAFLLNVTTSTVRDYWRAGRLPDPIKLSSRKWLWPYDAVMALLDGGGEK